jgi:hypothetical protein
MLNELGELYRAQKRFADAEPLYDRALQICLRGHMNPDHRLMRAVLANLAALYAEQGRNADVERLQRGDYLTGPSPR